jgi:hypothetical protein
MTPASSIDDVWLQVTAALRLIGSLFIYKVGPRAPRETPEIIQKLPEAPQRSPGGSLWAVGVSFWAAVGALEGCEGSRWADWGVRDDPGVNEPKVMERWSKTDSGDQK